MAELMVKGIERSLHSKEAPLEKVFIEFAGIRLVLLLSLTVEISFIPLLLLEEKEQKTLRRLIVTLTSFRDILIAKLLMVLADGVVNASQAFRNLSTIKSLSVKSRSAG